MRTTLLKLLLFLAFIGAASAQTCPAGYTLSGSQCIISAGSAAIACVGTPGNTTGTFRQQCQTGAGAVWACNNAAGCTVSADWVAVAGTGGGMTWPAAAGLAVYAGSSAWGTSLTQANGLTGITFTSSTPTLTALGTSATVNTGTSGATLGLLNGNLTFGGTNAYGTPASINLANAAFPTLNQNSTGFAAGIAGGTIGQFPYQSAANTTLFLAGNTAATDQVIISHGTGVAALAPTLTNAPALSMASMTNPQTWNQNTTGNALTATNLATYPTPCSGGQVSTGYTTGAPPTNNCVTPSGGGNVSNTGTPLIHQGAIWATATTQKGLTTFIIDDSGNVTGASFTTAGQFTSSISTGTAPLVISSTTQVANLNAATSGTATNLAGGAGGSTPYQTGSGATSFLASTGYSVAGTGTTNPQYITPSGNGQCLMSGASSFATTVPSFQVCPSGGGTGNVAATHSVTFSATPTFTCSSASAGTVDDFTLSTALTANVTSSTLSTCTTGQQLNFTFSQDGTGSRTVAMPTNFDKCNVSPTASSVTTCGYWYDGTNGRLVGTTSNDTPSVLLLSATRAAPTTVPAGGAAWPDSTDNDFEYRQTGGGTIFKMFAAGADCNPVTGICTKTNGSAFGTLATLNTLPLTDMATQVHDSIVMNGTSGTAAPTAVAMPTCTGSSSADVWDTTSHSWTCNTIQAGTVTSVATASGIAGGTFTTTGTVSLATIPNNQALCNNSGGTAAPTTADCTVTGTGSLVLATGPTLGIPASISGVTTVGLGVPVVGWQSVLTNSSATSLVTLATAPGAGDYEVHFNLDMHTACTTGTGQLALSFGWTGNSARTLATGNMTLASSQGTNSFISGVQPIHVASGNVTFTPTLNTACATGTATWDGNVYLTRTN